MLGNTINKKYFINNSFLPLTFPHLLAVKLKKQTDFIDKMGKIKGKETFPSVDCQNNVVKHNK